MSAGPGGGGGSAMGGRDVHQGHVNAPHCSGAPLWIPAGSSPRQLFGLRGMAGGAAEAGLLTDSPVECEPLLYKDRLRQAQGERTREARLRWVWGLGWGTETPRAAPLWIPAFAGIRRCGRPPLGGRCGRPPSRPSGQASTGSGRTDLGGAPLVGSGGWMGDGDAPRRAPLDSCLRRNDACGRPPSSALRTGFDRLRANGFGKRACGGEWGCDGGRRRPAPRPSGFLPSQE